MSAGDCGELLKEMDKIPAKIERILQRHSESGR
jgi:hypothetical protein